MDTSVAIDQHQIGRDCEFFLDPTQHAHINADTCSILITNSCQTLHLLHLYCIQLCTHFAISIHNVKEAWLFGANQCIDVDDLIPWCICLQDLKFIGEPTILLVSLSLGT